VGGQQQKPTPFNGFTTIHGISAMYLQPRNGKYMELSRKITTGSKKTPGKSPHHLKGLNIKVHIEFS